MLRRSFSILLITSLLLGLLIPLLYGGRETLAAVERLPSWGLGLLLLLVLASWIFGAFRLRVMCCGLGLRLNLRTALATVISKDFASVATPGGSGSAPALVMILGRKGMSAAHSAAVLVVHGLADLAFFVTALPLIALFHLSQAHEGNPVHVVGSLLSFLVIGVALMWLSVHYHRPLLLFLGRLMQPFHRFKKMRYRVARMVIQFRQAVAVILRMPLNQLIRIYIYTTGHWLLRYSVLPILLWLIDQWVPWSYLFLIQPLLLFGGMLILLPGGVGGVEVGYGVLMHPFLEDAHLVAFTLLVWRFCTFYWYLIAGLPVFLAQSGRSLQLLWQSSEQRG